MFNVLVTGGAGFIGSNLVNELLQLEINNVFVFDNLSTGRLSNIPINHPRLKFYDLNLLSDFKDWPELDNLKYIYHFSANADVRGGVINRNIDLEQNVLVTKSVCDYAKKQNANNEKTNASTAKKKFLNCEKTNFVVTKMIFTIFWS